MIGLMRTYERSLVAIIFCSYCIIKKAKTKCRNKTREENYVFKKNRSRKENKEDLIKKKRSKSKGKNRKNI